MGNAGIIVAMRQNSVSATPTVFRRRLLGSGSPQGFRTAAGIAAVTAATGWVAAFGALGAGPANAAEVNAAEASTNTAETSTTSAVTLAQAVDAGRLESQLVDGVGILNDEQKQAITEELKALQQSDRIQFYIVYTDTFGSMSSQEFAETTAAANGGGQGSNVGVLAIAVEDRQYDVYASQVELGARTNSMLHPLRLTTS